MNRYQISMVSLHHVFSDVGVTCVCMSCKHNLLLVWHLLNHVLLCLRKGSWRVIDRETRSQEMNVEKALEAMAATMSWRSQSGAAEARTKLLTNTELPFSDFPFSSQGAIEKACFSLACLKFDFQFTFALVEFVEFGTVGFKTLRPDRAAQARKFSIFCLNVREVLPWTNVDCPMQFDVLDWQMQWACFPRSPKMIWSCSKSTWMSGAYSSWNSTPSKLENSVAFWLCRTCLHLKAFWMHGGSRVRRQV